MMQKLWRAKRQLKYRLNSHALILLYHRIARLENDPHLLAVAPEHFAGHLEVIRRHGLPISLHELVRTLKAGKVPNRAVIITFDDGYADNLHHAKALLEHYEIPATVFVTSDQLGSQREFWWDELDRLFLQPGTLPPKLCLDLNGNVHEWNLDNAAEYSQVDYQRDKDWHIEHNDEPTIRHLIFMELFHRLYVLSDQDKQKVLADLRRWAGVEPTARSTHRFLTSDEMAVLTASGLIQIGAHTMSHPLLANLPVEEQRQQIQHSRDCLEAALKKPVTSFAFPHGSYTPETISILEESGFDSACTSDANVVWKSADLLQLPRLGVRNWDRNEFARWLSWWMDG